MKKPQESREYLAGGRLPQLRTEELTAGNHGSQHVESFASLCLDEVPLPAWRPGAPVGVNLGEPHLVDVGQCDFTRSRATPKLRDLGLSSSEGGFITFFLESGGSASTPCRTTSMPSSKCRRSLELRRSVRAGPVAVWPSMALRLPLQRSWPTARA